MESSNQNPIDTEKSAPSESDSALATMASSAQIDTLLSDADIANPSFNFVENCIRRTAIVFPPNATSPGDYQTLCEIYTNLLQGYSNEQIGEAFKVCAKTLPRFPYPSDLLAVANPGEPCGEAVARPAARPNHLAETA